MVTVRSLWLLDALMEPSLLVPLGVLKLRWGQFNTLYAMTLEGKMEYPVRCFLAEGLRGGVHGVLLAYRISSGAKRIGVYVRKKNRREGVGTSLVDAARSYYPKGKLLGSSWNTPSTRFWDHVSPVTQSEVKFYEPIRSVKNYLIDTAGKRAAANRTTNPPKKKQGINMTEVKFPHCDSRVLHRPHSC